MSAKTILTLLFLASLGAVVILGLQALPHRANPDAATRDEILVATAALPPGTLLRAKDVAWQPVSSPLQPGQIARSGGVAGKVNSEPDQQAPSEIYGAALRAVVKAGDPIRRNAIAKPGDRDFLQIVLAPHARAIAIPVATGGASTGILYPGDRVDVILTQTFKNNPPLARRSVGETIVENLRVLAIDLSDAKPNAGGHSFGRTVTLEVRDKAKLDVIKVGDPVIARYVEALAIEVKKPGTTTPGTTVQESRVSSNPGETPAGAVGREVSVTATVTAIDKKGRTVTIKGPEGNSETIKAVDPKNLDAVKVGDMVEIRYFQALAVSLDKSAGK